MRQKYAVFLVTLFSLAHLGGCTTLRQSSGIDPEYNAQGSRLLGDATALGAQLDAQLRRDGVVEPAIQAIAQKLDFSRREEVRLLDPGLTIAEPIYVKPERTWYFNVLALRGLKFENELAAAVAAAQVLSILPSDLKVSWRMVNREMVKALYRAGYDPRGVVAFWKNWGQALRQSAAPRSQDYVWGALSLDLEEEARLEIAKLPPLLNPVVRSPEFVKIGKRLQKL
jgi:hypothetical protein